MNLLEGQIGSTYTVVGLKLEKTIQRRLEALGLTSGTRVVVLNKKRNGSVIFKVRGTRLAVGHDIADSIELGREDR